MTRMTRMTRTLLAIAALMLTLAFSAPPCTGDEGRPGKGFLNLDARWGGHVKLRGSATEAESRSIYGLVDEGTYVDGALEARLTNRTFFMEELYGEAHYEVLLTGGDTQETRQELLRRFPRLLEGSTLLDTGLEDDRRFLDLTTTLRERDGYALTHRLDRLFLAWTPGRTTIRAGRQAVTWGNGLLFNPMDLVNPFAPTDIEREYKVGDDMVSLRFPAGGTGEAEILYVPRRSIESGDVSWEESSLAGRLHLARGTLELDLLGAVHYRDTVVGLGATGYAGGAAWRLDATWTFLEDRTQKDGYLSLVANVDYSWVWWDRNVYGFLELFYCGLGESDPAEALVTPDLMERIGRGELFTLGSTYLAGHIQVEVHPLVSVLTTVIHRLNEPSGLIQPRVTWDATPNLQVTLGGTVPYGGPGTEFGGIPIAGTGVFTPSSPSVFCWATRYF